MTNAIASMCALSLESSFAGNRVVSTSSRAAVSARKTGVVAVPAQQVAAVPSQIRGSCLAVASLDPAVSLNSFSRRSSRGRFGGLQAKKDAFPVGFGAIGSDFSFGRAAEAALTRRRGACAVSENTVVGESKSSEAEESKKVDAGTRVRVKGPLLVFHVPKNPELDIGGMEGDVKEIVLTYKGKPVSATFPYKVQFSIDGEGKKIKFFAHLKEDEFEIVK